MRANIAALSSDLKPALLARRRGGVRQRLRQWTEYEESRPTRITAVFVFFNLTPFRTKPHRPEENAMP